MALTSNKQILELSEYEFCYNCITRGPCSAGGTMEMYIPKLMPDIGLCEPKILPYPFEGDAVFANSAECAPGSDIEFPYQNYINVPLLFNCDDWEHLLVNGLVIKGTKFLCTFVNNDITKYHFTTNL